MLCNFTIQLTLPWKLTIRYNDAVMTVATKISEVEIETQRTVNVMQKLNGAIQLQKYNLFIQGN